jgi:hypothetical protein
MEIKEDQPIEESKVIGPGFVARQSVTVTHIRQNRF